MLTIRLTRKGKKNQPFFKVVVIDKRRSSKGGKAVEDLGYIDPLTKKKSFKKERVLYWISKGAKPTPTIHNYLVAEKIIDAKKINVSKKSKKSDVLATPTPTPDVNETSTSGVNVAPAPEVKPTGVPATAPAPASEVKPAEEVKLPKSPEEEATGTPAAESGLGATKPAEPAPVETPKDLPAPTEELKLAEPAIIEAPKEEVEKEPAPVEEVKPVEEAKPTGETKLPKPRDGAGTPAEGLGAEEQPPVA